MTSLKIHFLPINYYKRLSETAKTAVFVALIITVVSGMFVYSVSIRKPWLGTLYSPHNINPTANTLFFAQKWFKEGAIKLKFASIQDIHSVETDSTYPSRFYVSWPPGYLVPVHLTALITGKPPTAVGIMKLNLFYHLICSIFLSLGIFFLLLWTGIRRASSGLLALIPALVFLFTTGTLWFMQAVYYSGQPGMLWFVLYLFLEILRMDIKKPGPRRIIDVFQFLVVFAAVLTDYFFYFVIFMAFLLRIMNREISLQPKHFIRQSLIFWSPAILAGLLFLSQLLYLNTLSQIISRAVFRTGRSGGVDFLVTQFWNYHLPISFGQTGKILIFVSIAVIVIFLIGTTIDSIWSKRPIGFATDRLFTIASLSLFPQILYVFVLKNAHANHLFMSLPFAVTLALVPFVLFPVLVYVNFQRLIDARSHHYASDYPFVSKYHSIRFPVALAVILLVAAAGYAFSEKNRMGVLFKLSTTASESSTHERIYRFIGKHTGYDDVVFSPFMEVRCKNKVPLILTGNNIYKLFSLHDIFYKVRNISQPFNICIVIDRRYRTPAWLLPLTRDTPAAESKELIMYKTDGRHFLELYKRYFPLDRGETYFRERQEYENLRNQLAVYLSRNNYETALIPLRKILAFLEKQNAVSFNSRYALAEIAILDILNRKEEASERLTLLRRFRIFPERHLIWGWNPDPVVLKIIRMHPVTNQILIKGLL